MHTRYNKEEKRGKNIKNIKQSLIALVFLISCCSVLIDGTTLPAFASTANQSTLTNVEYAVSNSQTGASATYAFQGTTDTTSNPTGQNISNLNMSLPNGTTFTSSVSATLTNQSWISMSCPTTSYCFAISNTGYTAYSTSASSNIWTASTSSVLGNNNWYAISCPTVIECVAISYTGYVAYSTSPTSNVWTASGSAVISADNWTSLVCPSATQCFALGGTGYIASSTTPTTNTWTLSGSALLGNETWASISCPTTSYCFAAGGTGYVAYSSTPTTSWTTGTLGSETWTSISCPTTSYCFAVDNAGDIVGTSTPTTITTGSWTVLSLGSQTWQSISCPTISNCYAISTTGYSVKSTTPTTFTTGSWVVSTTAILGNNTWKSMSCPSAFYCFAVSSTGYVSQSTSPNTNQWSDAVETPSLISNYGIGAGSLSGAGLAPFDTNTIFNFTCTDTNNCWAVGAGDIVLHTVNGGASWTQIDSSLLNIPAGDSYITGISCPTDSVCYAVGGASNINLVGTSSNTGFIINTTNAGLSWTLLDTTSAGQPIDIGCISSSTCVAVGYEGSGGASAVASYNTTNSGTSWTTLDMAVSGASVANFFGISCVVSTTTCFAVGNVTISTHPYLLVDSSVLSGTWGAWSVDYQTSHYAVGLFGISCVSNSFCEISGLDETSLGAGIWGCSTSPCTTSGNWAEQSLSGLTPGYLPYALSCTSTTSCVAITNNCSSPLSCTIAVNSNITNVLFYNGTSWSAISTPSSTQDIGMVTCISSTNCLLLGANGTIWGTSNLSAGGNSVIWTLQTYIPIITYSVSSIQTVPAGTPFYLSFSGITNPTTPGTFYNVIQTYVIGTDNLPGVVDTGVTNSVVYGSSTSAATIVIPESLTFTNDSPSFQLMPIPGGVQATHTTTLTIGTNAGGGYSLDVSSTLLTTGTYTVPADSTTGTAGATITTDTFGFMPGLTRSATSNASLSTGSPNYDTYSNGANGSGTAGFYGYEASATPLASSTNPTGNTADTITLENAIKIDYLQQAGTYNCTITYVVVPSY